MTLPPASAAAPTDVAAPAAADAEAIAAAVASCPSVARLVGGGPGDQVATFLPGRRVVGVRLTDREVEVHVATRWDSPIPAAASEIRTAVASLVGGRRVSVAVDDVDDPLAVPSTGSDAAPPTARRPPS